MSRSSRALAAGRVTLGALGVAAAGPGAARAQTPPARPDSARADSARRAAVSDSSRRDSVIARQLRAARRRDGLAAPLAALDRLRLTAVGATAGVALPDQVAPTTVYAVHADYGAVLRDVRLSFGVAYWSSAFRPAAVAQFARTVAAAVTAPAPPPEALDFGRMRVSDVALNADLRWRPLTIRGRRVPALLRPWAALGAGVHLLDVQGAAIRGTIVERLLDGVAFGAAGSAGVDVPTAPHLQLTAAGRYDLFNGARFASVRAGASYYFDRRRP